MIRKNSFHVTLSSDDLTESADETNGKTQVFTLSTRENRQVMRETTALATNPTFVTNSCAFYSLHPQNQPAWDTLFLSNLLHIDTKGEKVLSEFQAHLIDEMRGDCKHAK